MQIGLLNHLTFPKGSNQPLAGNSSDARTTVADGTAAPGLGATLRAWAPVQDAPSVILKLQNENAATPGVALAKGLVYSDARKSTASKDENSDTVRMAAQHQQAVARNAGSTSSLSVDKDGVMVAQSASPEEIKAQQFMHFAVAAMRDYADASDRVKTGAAGQEDIAGARIPRGLSEVQKLAARFRMFA